MPKFGRLRSTLGEFEPNLAEPLPSLAGSGLVWLRSAEFGPSFSFAGPNSAKLGPNSAVFDHTWPDFDSIQPNFGQIRHDFG